MGFLVNGGQAESRTYESKRVEVNAEPFKSITYIYSTVCLYLQINQSKMATPLFQMVRRMNWGFLAPESQRIDIWGYGTKTYHPVQLSGLLTGRHQEWTMWLMLVVVMDHVVHLEAAG
ncbi:unnamed protein product [Lactuca virosa]|uniref:Uncharacterized protein n=1 Tax=Lactuca virosa TaxID=75947 RepID=A0AAU9MXE3_9ASTR|nr:unnamed protein product [Lactuca virosa]